MVQTWALGFTFRGCSSLDPTLSSAFMHFQARGWIQDSELKTRNPKTANARLGEGPGCESQRYGFVQAKSLRYMLRVIPIEVLLEHALNSP